MREPCLYLFPATDGSVYLNQAVHNLLSPTQVMPAVVKEVSCKDFIVVRFVV